MTDVKFTDFKVPHTGVVLVGTDGSDGAARAVAFAADEAKARGAKLMVAHSWFIPNFGYGSAYVAPVTDIENAAKEILDKILTQAKAEYPDLAIEGRLLEGTPGVRLCEIAEKEAEVMVIGTRGHGSFTSLLLGSVSSYVLHHSPVPVLLVRPEVDQS